MSERRACSAATQHRSSQRYEAKRADDEPRVLTRMQELVREHPRFGYRRIAKLLQREGHRIGFDRAYRLWRREGLKVPRKAKKKRRVGDSHQGCIRHRVEKRNHVWAWDFVFDSTSSGSSLKWLAIAEFVTRTSWTCCEGCSLLMGFPNIFDPTMAQSSLRPAFASGWITRVLAHCIFRRAVRGKTVTQKVSTVG